MNDCLITFRSITPAQRGQELLERLGIRCSLRRTPSELARQGCGYAAALPASQAHIAWEALRQNEIPFQRIFSLENGAYRELMV